MLTGKQAIPLLDLLSTDARDGVSEMNRLGARGIPYVYMTDSWSERWVVKEIPDAISSGIRWQLDGAGTLGTANPPPGKYRFNASVVSREQYSKGFEEIHRAQLRGDSWLANLTFPSIVDTDLSLEAIAKLASAPFRLFVPGHLTVFSPERFVRIGESGTISSFPMKGTIDASIPEAADILLADEKEAAEHVTIVDLIRNDLSIVAEKVEVPRYRFITEVKTRSRSLLQMSSEVSGELGSDWQKHVGTILGKLLPAGSVTGAPKKRTAEIIRKAEDYDRGWYTGTFGFFDGRTLDSAVMIRFIEQAAEDTLIYKSGGGITIYSDMAAEYAELKAKIYAPFS